MEDKRDLLEEDVFEETNEPQEPATLIKIYDNEEEQDDSKGIKKFFNNIKRKIKNFSRNLVNKIAASKFAKAMKTAWFKGILPALTIKF